ncbi:hypothetical protein Pla123a_43330 [Posidoniimonas polymericola]|uniref:Uncharacterized protein n=1 Tax=Posidoniimonas polymericola TaxID=2528002 RepID=A0A5C5XYA8_9BACT|nr:hypothetical protein [Posidoniimonas polymericola]TWT66905.1 hypothetical protein Pla123a_43330 [Posidoniimonas polymericola]
MSTNLPTLTMWTLKETPHPLTLVELTQPACSDHLFAVVLDFSDSTSYSDLPVEATLKVAELLPRKTPFIVFRMSSGSPLLPWGEYSVGDLIGDPGLLERWGESEELIAEAALQGSFIRPVIESLAQNASDNGCVQCTLLALTDGELLDGAEAQVPPGMRIAGLVKSMDPRKQQHWQRVLPGRPLLTPTDAKIDRFITDGFPKGTRLCELHWSNHSQKATAEAWKLDIHGHRLVIDTPWKVQGNLFSGALRIVVLGTAEEVASLPWRLVTPKAEHTLEATLGEHSVGITKRFMENAAASLEESSGTWRILLNVRRGELHFDRASQAAAKVRELASTRSQRNVSNHQLLLGGLPLDEWKAARTADEGIDALLFFVKSTPGEATIAEQVVVAALGRSQTGAMLFVRGEETPCGLAGEDAAIKFRREQNRWFLEKQDCPPVELEPFGSQEIPDRLLADEAWEILFSGDLN